MLLYIITIVMSVFALGYFIGDIARFIGHAIIVASPRENNTNRKVDGITLWPVWVMMVTIPYIAWFLITR